MKIISRTGRPVVTIIDIKMSSEVRDKSSYDDKGRPSNGAGLLSELRSSGLVGMWTDRKDLGPSSKVARDLRDLAYRRKD